MHLLYHLSVVKNERKCLMLQGKIWEFLEYGVGILIGAGWRLCCLHTFVHNLINLQVIFTRAMAGHKRKYQNNKDNDAFKKPRYDDGKYEIVKLVQQQAGVRGQLVLFHSSIDFPFTILHNAVDRINGKLNVTKVGQDPKEGMYKYQLSINNEVLAEGLYRSEAVAKKDLAELAVTTLKKSCFTIFRKIQPQDLPKVNLTSSSPSNSSSNNAPPSSSSDNSSGTAPSQSNPPIGGIGAKMMMRMGWSGNKGLGAQEQGRVDIVQPYIQIQRQGLGTKNVVQEVRKVLEEYAHSKDLNSIAFSPEFSKDERAVIHQVARRLHLTSRSYGQGDDRMLVIRTRIRPWDMIYSLIEAGGETEQLQLIVPTDFDK